MPRSCPSILLVVLPLLICSLPTPVCAAITIQPDEQYRFAEYLYEQGRYAQAGAEYHRFAYFFPADPRQRDALLRAGSAFLQAGDHAAAQTVLRSLSQMPDPDALAIEASFLLAETYLQTSGPGQAVITLHNLISIADDDRVADRAYYRMGWIQIDQLNWEAALQAFDHISHAGTSRYRTTELRRAIVERDALPSKSPILAGVLSIIPGAGQFYNGRYEDALTAFVVDVGLLWAAFESYENELNVLGTLLAIVGAGFYTSNIYGAVSSAHKYNRDQQAGFAEQLRNRLQVSVGPSFHSMAGGPMLTWQIKF